MLGDFNGNGVVDAADYTVWRDELGQMGGGLAADGNGDGIVDTTDYNIWRDHYSAPSSGAAAGVAVPESSTAALLVIGCVVALVARRR